MKSRVILANTLTAVLLAIGFGGTGAAATLPASTFANISSVRVDGGRVFWFQRGTGDDFFNEFENPYLSAPGSILSRKLGSDKVERIFMPQGNQSIAGFNVAAGRVVVGLTYVGRSETSSPSSIVELSEGATGWKQTILMSQTGVKENGNCGDWLWLVNINAQGDVIVDDHLREGSNGGCELVRLRSRAVAIARNGVQRQISNTTSGWGAKTEFDALGRLQAGAGDWYVTSGSYNDTVVPTGIRNIETGKQFSFSELNEQISRSEVAPNGQVMLIDEYARGGLTMLINDPTKPDQSIVLRRPNYRSFFHFCGGKIIEIARRKADKRHPAGKSWNLYLRDINGGQTQHLKIRLSRGTSFEMCNEQLAFFHTLLHNGRARQFSVPLIPPIEGATGVTAAAATSATGPTP